MKFLLVDRIESIEPGKRIVTTKALTLAEEYLGDHFPAFPVMPGVLMLEALVQSAAWLVRIEQDFSRSVVVLASARNVRYANFVQPGRKLRCELDAMSIDSDSAKFKGVGWLDDGQAVSARLELKCFNLAGRSGYLAEADESIVSDLKQQFKLVGGPVALAAAGQ
ncbi:MAG: beta-hydroxyacyl-ACP dehydratase [bacterium]|nr:beta-hydroxyacyl-ACP dehydratase [bacterium]